jgi:hypothetical protein
MLRAPGCHAAGAGGQDPREERNWPAGRPHVVKRLTGLLDRIPPGSR